MAILKIRHPLGGEVIVPSLTWISDISSVIQNGFTPVFVDINPRNLCMSEEHIIKKINKNNRLMLHAHKIMFSINNIKYNFEAKYGEEFEQLIKRKF